MSSNIITPDRPTALVRAAQALTAGTAIYSSYQQARRIADQLEPYRQQVQNYIRGRQKSMPSRLRKRKRGQSYKRRSSRRYARKFTGGNGITKEHDRANIYRKRKMPRFKKRRWKRFSKKVLAVSEKDMGTQTVVFNDTLESGDFLNTDASKTGSVTLGLYTLNGAQTTMQDLSVMMLDLHTGAPTVASGTTKYASTNVIFKSGVFDLTLTNTCYDRIGGTNNINSAYTLEVDVHVVSIRKPLSDLTTLTLSGGGTQVAEVGIPNIDEAIKMAELSVKKIGGDDNKIFDTTAGKFNRGGTLWDTPHGLGTFGMKIWSKRKYFIPGGQTMTYQMRDAKRRVMTPEWNMVGSNKPGWTKFLYITYKLCPGIGTVGALNATDIRTRISCGVTRKYSYKIEGVNDIRDNYNPTTA